MGNCLLSRSSGDGGQLAIKSGASGELHDMNGRYVCTGDGILTLSSYGSYAYHCQLNGTRFTVASDSGGKYVTGGGRLCKTGDVLTGENGGGAFVIGYF